MSSSEREAALQHLMAAERRVTRRVDRRLIDAGSLESVDPFYLPEAGNTFELPCFWVDEARVHRFEAAPVAGLSDGHRALFFVHPLALRHYRTWLERCEPGPRFFATATSSTRTVFAWSEGRAPLCLKLSLPVLFATERRVVTGELAAEAVRTTVALAERGVHGATPAMRRATAPPASRRERLLVSAARFVTPAGDADRGSTVTRRTTAFPGTEPRDVSFVPPSKRPGLSFLPEPLGVVPRDVDLGGFLVRELPRGVKLTPWFALERPERHIAPFLRAWMTSAIHQGWVAEVHAQNVLVGGGRYWVRDMDSVYVDDPELEGARTSLHTYFLGGPARAHRKLFFRELARHAGDAARDPDAFAQWLEDERHFARRAVKPPAQVRRWLKREQTQNARSRDPKRFAEVTHDVLPRRFRPEPEPVWRLPYFVAPLKRVQVYGAARPPALFAEGGVRVFFHPHLAEHHALDVLEYGAGRETFWATPTASPRSVVVWNGEHVFGLKLSLDVELLGINRRVEDSKLRRAVAVSSVLRDVRVLREPVAVRTEEKDYGFIYRELPAGMNRLTPGFALRLNARVLERRVFPALVRAFAELAFGQGLIGDLHQQNVLFTPKYEVVLRDLDSFKCDEELRTLRGLKTPAGMKVDARAYHRAWTEELRAVDAPGDEGDSEAGAPPAVGAARRAAVRGGRAAPGREGGGGGARRAAAARVAHAVQAERAVRAAVRAGRDGARMEGGGDRGSSASLAGSIFRTAGSQSQPHPHPPSPQVVELSAGAQVDDGTGER